MKKTTSWLATATCLALPLAAVAQAKPAGREAPGQALRYESAFSDYTPWQDVQPGNWRALNDAVRGAPAGHGAAPIPATPTGRAVPGPASPAASQPAPAASQRGAHRMQGGQP